MPLNKAEGRPWRSPEEVCWAGEMREDEVTLGLKKTIRELRLYSDRAKELCIDDVTISLEKNAKSLTQNHRTHASSSA